jgi:transposase-like protein
MATDHVTEEVRFQIVLAILRNEKSQSELSRSHGISQNAISKWVKNFLETGKEGLRKRRASRISHREQELETENEELKKTIGELAQECRILKKVQRLSQNGKG